MLLNDIADLLQGIPPVLAGSWAAWLFIGMLIVRWQRRDRGTLVVHTASSREKSGVRPPASPRVPSRPVKTAPMSKGDAFSELEALLDAAPEGTHRMPGESESPVLTNSAGAVSRALAAPQSLP